MKRLERISPSHLPELGFYIQPLNRKPTYGVELLWIIVPFQKISVLYDNSMGWLSIRVS